jgi:hypothetical protein
MFKPGESGNPGGRPRRYLKRPDEILAAKGICPVEEILKLLPDLTKAKQAEVWLEILPYLAAKIKEMPAEPDEVAKLSNKDLLEMVKAKIPELEKVA